MGIINTYWMSIRWRQNDKNMAIVRPLKCWQQIQQFEKCQAIKKLVDFHTWRCKHPSVDFFRIFSPRWLAGVVQNVRDLSRNQAKMVHLAQSWHMLGNIQ